MAKYLLIVAVVISLATIVLGVFNHGTLVQTKQDLADTRASLATAQSSLGKMKGALTDSEKKLADKTAEQEKIAADLTTAQSDLDSAKKQLADKNAETTDKDAQITSLKAENDKLTKDLAQATGHSGGEVVEDPRIKELEDMNNSLNAQIKTAEAQVADYKSRDEARKKALWRKGLEGRVLAVNPAWNFVVLSVGDRQGAVNNAELLVKRGGQYLGKVRVTSVEPSTSIADIVANSLPSGVSVQPGDSVIFPDKDTDN